MLQNFNAVCFVCQRNDLGNTQELAKHLQETEKPITVPTSPHPDFPHFAIVFVFCRSFRIRFSGTPKKHWCQFSATITYYGGWSHYWKAVMVPVILKNAAVAKAKKYTQLLLRRVKKTLLKEYVDFYSLLVSLILRIEALLLSGGRWGFAGPSWTKWERPARINVNLPCCNVGFAALHGSIICRYSQHTLRPNLCLFPFWCRSILKVPCVYFKIFRGRMTYACLEKPRIELSG